MSSTSRKGSMWTPGQEVWSACPALADSLPGENCQDSLLTTNHDMYISNLSCLLKALVVGRPWLWSIPIVVLAFISCWTVCKYWARPGQCWLCEGKTSAAFKQFVQGFFGSTRKCQNFHRPSWYDDVAVLGFSCHPIFIFSSMFWIVLATKFLSILSTIVLSCSALSHHWRFVHWRETSKSCSHRFSKQSICGVDMFWMKETDVATNYIVARTLQS